MAKVVSAIFRTRSSATLAVEDLLRRGFPQEDISMVLTDTLNGREYAVARTSEASNGALIGAAILAPVLGVLAALMAAGQLPAFGANFTADSITAFWAGVGLGGLMGGVIGCLIGMTMPKYEARFYSFKPHSAGILVGVYVDQPHLLEAKRILEAAGGAHVAERKIGTHRLFRSREELQPEPAPAMMSRERGDVAVSREREDIGQRPTDREPLPPE